MRKRRLTIIYPQYFDKNRSRKYGRRLPKNLASSAPTVEDIFLASQKSGYFAEMDLNSKYPRTWWDKPGIVLVDGMGQKKTFILNKIASKVDEAIKERKEERLQSKSKKKVSTQKLKAQEALKERLKKKNYGS